MITFDANILFYAGDDRDPSKRDRCAAVMQGAAEQDAGFVTLQALGEFVHASVRKGLLQRPRAAQLARDWTAVFEVRCAGADAFDKALEWWADERLSYWDALLLATASKEGAGACVSEDFQDGAVIGGVEIVNPFAADAPERLSVHGLILA